MLKASRADTNYCWTLQGQFGPIKARLFSYELRRGLVFGACREASQPVHQLYKAIDTSCVAVEVPQRDIESLNSARKS